LFYDITKGVFLFRLWGRIKMNFIVSLAHFVGWVVTIPALVYLVISLSLTLYAGIFWYDKHGIGDTGSRKDYAVQVGFLNLWEWFSEILLLFLQKISIRSCLKDGKTNEEIANILGISSNAVDQINERSIFCLVWFSDVKEYRCYD
jgi:hypothetical protein